MFFFFLICFRTKLKCCHLGFTIELNRRIILTNAMKIMLSSLRKFNLILNCDLYT